MEYTEVQKLAEAVLKMEDQAEVKSVLSEFIAEKE